MNAKSLKYPAAFLCLASLALATGCARQKPTTSHPHTPAPNGPGSTSHPPTVFQKAFWKHPAAWVLSNPFLLATASSLPAGSSRPADDQPAWFPEPIPGGHCFASPARNLRISLSHDGKILHATDSGGGLASALPSPQDR
jgi:hypothetical protein